MILYTTGDGKTFSVGDGTFLVVGEGNIPELITDRTLTDVERWRELRDKGFAAMNEAERAEWLGFMKGRYTSEDMNRVEIAVEMLVEALMGLGYPYPHLVTKTDWTREDCPTVDDFNRYFSNVEKLREAIAVPKNTPNTPTVGTKLDYRRANDLEKILIAIDGSITNLPKAWYYAEDIFSGEV